MDSSSQTLLTLKTSWETLFNIVLISYSIELILTRLRTDQILDFEPFSFGVSRMSSPFLSISPRVTCTDKHLDAYV